MGSPFKERRFGRLQVSMEFLEGAEDHEIALVFGDMRIFRAEHIVCSNMVHYEACSPMFEPVEAGSMPPWYEVKVTERRYSDAEAAQTGQADSGLTIEVVKKDIQREFGR